MLSDEKLIIPTDWQEHGESDLALDAGEAAFAERCYIERHPPIPSEFVGHYTRAVPELREPAWPPWAKYELLFRCIFAQRSIWSRDESYRFYRNIYTGEEQEAARERRARAKYAAKEWRDTGNQVALEDMLEALEEIHAERGRA